MARFAEPMSRLIDELRKLPGIGTKSAQRLAFHVLRASDADARALAGAVLELREKLRLCSVCNNITDVDPCGYCTVSYTHLLPGLLADAGEDDAFERGLVGAADAFEFTAGDDVEAGAELGEEAEDGEGGVGLDGVADGVGAVSYTHLLRARRCRAGWRA